MGATMIEEYGGDVVAEAVESAPSVDCKELALKLADSGTNIEVVRGYVTFWSPGAAKVFTEHWWCHERGAIRDATPCASFPRVQYHLLREDELFSLCDVWDGPCKEAKECAWCEGRRRLKDAGFSRAAIYARPPRAIVDRLMLENAKLRRELEAEIAKARLASQPSDGGAR